MNDREIYLSCIRSLHNLTTNCGAPPIIMEQRAYIITAIEKIIFSAGKTISSEFRRLSDLYIARGLEALGNDNL